MNRYKDIIADLGYRRAAHIVDPRVAEWFGIYAAPAEWYGFPPALLPLLSDGSLPSYLGLWKHWFIAREPSMCELSVSDDYRTREIARTDQQFAELMVGRLIVARDGVDRDVLALAALLEVDNVDQIDAVTLETGDDAKGFRTLPAFARRAPLASSETAVYDGEFPVPQRPRTGSCCYFDYDRELFHHLPSHPDWLDPESDKPILFRQYLERGAFGEAWLALNGTGWRFPDAARALEGLLRASEPPMLLERIAEVWIAQAADDQSGY